MNETLRDLPALSAQMIVTAWELGRNRHPVDRALLLLALACPALSPASLSTLTVGQRNACLLILRQRTLGVSAACLVECPACQTPLEFTVDTTTLLEPEPAAITGQVRMPHWHIDYRLPTSLDLAAIAGQSALTTARRQLIERCITRVECDGQELETPALPETVIGALATAIVEQDPQVEMAFKLSCSTCEHHWTGVFDIVAFFWEELEVQARQLLQEVHTLASAYGWHENAILALSPLRRQAYLELVRL